MTDQRQIDVSTLRDGDYVRAEGDGWAAEGYYYRREIRSKAGWNVVCLSGEPDERVTILRPVLVKGDRVEWVGAPRKRKASTATVSQVNGDRAAVIRDDDVADKWPIEAVRRLPTAPEPAPIKVGDWWADEEGIPHVVEALNTLAEVADLRRWEHDRRSTSQITYRGLRKNWTRLDSPPEPLVGKLYVIGGVVRQSTEHGWHRSFNGSAHRWDEICAALDKDRLATLRILGSVD